MNIADNCQYVDRICDDNDANKTLRSAFKSKSLIYHPDKADGDNSVMQNLTEAKDILKETEYWNITCAEIKILCLNAQQPTQLPSSLSCVCVPREMGKLW